MAIVNIDPNSGRFAQIRSGGKYGPGMPNEADCECIDYVHEVEPGSKNAPAFDRDCERDEYCMFVFRVEESDQVVYHREHQPKKAFSRSKALVWIKALGAPVDDDGNFDDETVANHKCALEFAEPKPSRKEGADPEVKFTRVLQVIGLS